MTTCRTDEPAGNVALIQACFAIPVCPIEAWLSSNQVLGDQMKSAGDGEKYGRKLSLFAAAASRFRNRFWRNKLQCPTVMSVDPFGCWGKGAP